DTENGDTGKGDTEKGVVTAGDGGTGTPSQTGGADTSAAAADRQRWYTGGSALDVPKWRGSAHRFARTEARTHRRCGGAVTTPPRIRALSCESCCAARTAGCRRCGSSPPHRGC